MMARTREAGGRDCLRWLLRRRTLEFVMVIAIQLCIAAEIHGRCRSCRFAGRSTFLKIVSSSDGLTYAAVRTV